MTRLTLFGAGGQLGVELLDRASRHGVLLQAFSRRQVDIANAAAVDAALAAAEPDAVINAAAYNNVDGAEVEREAAFCANASGPAVLARACALLDLPIVHISTDYVFDGTKVGAYREDDEVAPLGVYGASKAAGEAMLRKETSRHLILRTSWLYGVHGRNFLKTIVRLAGERETIPVVADQFGCPTGTADLAEAVLRLAPALKGDRFEWGTYHFAGTGATSRYEFAREIVAAQARFTGRNPVVQPIKSEDQPNAARRPANSELDCSRFAGAFGFGAMRWQDRVRDVVDLLCGRES